jgi:hypothetical protein
MKVSIKNGITMIKQRTRFLQGVAVGLFIMSAMTYAAVTITSFTPGTTISSTDVNANFANLKGRVDKLDTGFHTGLATNYTLLSCNSGLWNFTGATFEDISGFASSVNDGNFNATNGEYTIPSTGPYRVEFEARDTLSTSEGSGYAVRLAVSTDGGSTWTNENLSTNTYRSKTYTAGTKVKLVVGASMKFNACGGSNPVVQASTFYFAIRMF